MRRHASLAYLIIARRVPLCSASCFFPLGVLSHSARLLGVMLSRCRSISPDDQRGIRHPLSGSRDPANLPADPSGFRRPMLMWTPALHVHASGRCMQLSVEACSINCILKLKSSVTRRSTSVGGTRRRQRQRPLQSWSMQPSSPARPVHLHRDVGDVSFGARKRKQAEAPSPLRLSFASPVSLLPLTPSPRLLLSHSRPLRWPW